MMQIWNPVGSLVPCVLNDAELESTVGRFPSRSLNGGASPHLCGALHHLSVLSVGLFPISLTRLWGSSHSTVGLFSLYCGASPPLRGASSHCGALPHLAHSTVGLFSLYCGALLTLLWGFPTSPWGFISLWGSSPSRSLNWSLRGSSHSTAHSLSHGTRLDLGSCSWLCQVGGGGGGGGG